MNATSHSGPSHPNDARSGNEVAAMVLGWLSLDETQPCGGDKHFEADVHFKLAMSRDLFVGWFLIGLVIAATSRQRVLTQVGAGPLEDLLSEDPSRFVPIVVSEARRNGGLRVALGAVWLCEHYASDDLLLQLESTTSDFKRLNDCGCDLPVGA